MEPISEQGTSPWPNGTTAPQDHQKSGPAVGSSDCSKVPITTFYFFCPAGRVLCPWLTGRLFNGIVLDRDQLNSIRTLPPEAVIVYSIKFKSYFEYLFYHSRYRQEKLPVPELAFGFRLWPLQPMARILRSLLANIHWFLTHWRKMDPYANGYWREELLGGRSALLPLVEKHGFYRRFVKKQTDPLLFLIELQRSVDRPIYVVPHLMFFSKSPSSHYVRLRDVFFGTEQRPGLARRLFILFRRPGKVFVEISQPVDLQQFIASPESAGSTPEYQALRLRRQLLWQHNRHRQSITGPVVKAHEEIKENILVSDRLRQFMAAHAENKGESLHAVRKKADGYLDEIAAKYNHFFLSAVSHVAKWLFNTMYDGTVVDTAGLQRVKTMSQRGPLVLVPCHKSHIDYLILPIFFMSTICRAPISLRERTYRSGRWGPYFEPAAPFSCGAHFGAPFSTPKYLPNTSTNCWRRGLTWNSLSKAGAAAPENC
jgi:glycerol-3-phosphate O-acyltransferase